MAKDVPVSHPDLDHMIIEDRPSLFSVREQSISPYQVDYAGSESEGSAQAKDNRTMAEKLKGEIEHLENWLAIQKPGRDKSPLSVENTIRVLIATRKSLLDSLDHRDDQSGP